jgi:hypothetical protein
VTLSAAGRARRAALRASREPAADAHRDPPRGVLSDLCTRVGQAVMPTITTHLIRARGDGGMWMFRP